MSWYVIVIGVIVLSHAVALLILEYREENLYKSFWKLLSDRLPDFNGKIGTIDVTLFVVLLVPSEAVLIIFLPYLYFARLIFRAFVGDDDTPKPLPPNKSRKFKPKIDYNNYSSTITDALKIKTKLVH